MRVGQKNKLTYRWARTGSRPRAIHGQRTQSTYLFGAVCPEHGPGAALVLPFCNTEAMQLHLDEIAARVTITAASRGTRSSVNRGRSCPSPDAIGRSSVIHCEVWYDSITSSAVASAWSGRPIGRPEVRLEAVAGGLRDAQSSLTTN